MPPTGLIPVLAAARRELDGVPGIGGVGDPRSFDSGKTAGVPVAVELESDHPHLPRRTVWWIVADERFPWGRVVVYPDKRLGIAVTFPHQNMNREGDETHPWREGEICLREPESFLGRGAVHSEPIGQPKRMLWHGERLVAWCKAATAGKLLQTGDPFELPHFNSGSRQVAFIEDQESLQDWRRSSNVSGSFTFSMMPSGKLKLIRSFCDAAGNELHRSAWGTWADHLKPDERKGLWLRLSGMPVIEPYGAPQTWKQLRQCIRSMGVSFSDRMGPLLDAVRDGLPAVLLIGFPIPETVGGESVRLHWQPVQLPALAGSKRLPKGFNSPLRHDLAVTLKGRREVEWLNSRNWDQEERSSRGIVSAELVARRVALIGVGALGSAVGEILVRGGCREVTVVDPESLHIGNVVRHTLTASDVGELKATAVARRLEACNPNAVVRVRARSLQGATGDLLENADTVIDCTGEDDVLKSLSEMVWSRPVWFASASVGFGANRLFVFTAGGRSFPLGAFEEDIGHWLDEEKQRADLDDFPWDAVGCWHPTFPADVGDIQLLAAAAAKILVSTLGQAEPALAVLEQVLVSGQFVGLKRVDGAVRDV
jgi:hypothetical protein